MKVKIFRGFYWIKTADSSFIVEAKKAGRTFKFFRIGSEEPLNRIVEQCSRIQNPFEKQYPIYGIRNKENGWWMNRFANWGRPETYWSKPDSHSKALKLTKSEADEMLKEMNRGLEKYELELLPNTKIEDIE